MRRLIVYAGANGAGKSTLRDAADDPVEVAIDADRIARRLNPGDPRSADLAAAREVLWSFNHALKEGLSVSLETTLDLPQWLRELMPHIHVALEPTA